VQPVILGSTDCFWFVQPVYTVHFLLDYLNIDLPMKMPKIILELNMFVVTITK